MAPKTVAVTSLVLFGLFWLAVLVAGSGNPEYSQSRDYVSSLASVGAERPMIWAVAVALWALVRADDLRSS